jgi:hypothetical protein
MSGRVMKLMLKKLRRNLLLLHTFFGEKSAN